MHLVQLLLPLRDNDGRPQPPEAFARVRRELADRFGGLTAYSRAPAEGLWQEGEADDTARDEVVALEVMMDGLDEAWWRAYRGGLEALFRQDTVVVRALPMRPL